MPSLARTTYDVALIRVVLYIKQAMHRREPSSYFRRMLPEAICKVIGYPPTDNADAVRFIIAFSQSKVVDQVWRKRRKITRALSGKVGPEFYDSLSWKKVRYQALRRSSGKCECCGASGESAALHVDHIKPRSKYPELALALDNLQVLCADCNIGKLNTDETDWRKPKLRLVA